MKIIPCVYANESGHVVRNPVEIPDEIVDAIISYEAGNLDQSSVIQLFQKLININLAWQLQGSYSRLANQLLAAGLCKTPKVAA